MLHGVKYKEGNQAGREVRDEKIKKFREGKGRGLG